MFIVSECLLVTPQILPQFGPHRLVLGLPMQLMHDLSYARQDDVARLELAQERGVFSVKVGVHGLGTTLTQEAVFASKTRVAECLSASPADGLLEEQLVGFQTQTLTQEIVSSVFQIFSQTICRFRVLTLEPLVSVFVALGQPRISHQPPPSLRLYAETGCPGSVAATSPPSRRIELCLKV